MFERGRFVSKPLTVELGPSGLNFTRADIEIIGIDQSGPSYEGRIFVDNPTADHSTPLTREKGYAGSFHVYGYGIWPGDVEKRATGVNIDPDSIRAPIDKTVVATEAIRSALARHPSVTITIVPVHPGHPPKDAGDAFKFKSAKILVR